MSLTAIAMQVLINGFILGCMYGVAAIGLSLIFGSMRIIFIAQGDVIVLAAYVIFVLTRALGFDPIICLIPGIILFMIFGWLMYKGLFQRVAGKSQNSSMLLAFGLMVVLESLMSIIWSPNPRAINTAYTNLTFSFGNINVTAPGLITIGLGIAAALLVWVFLTKTIWGKAVRGASEDMTAASLLGISPIKISAITFAIGIGLASVAGLAVSINYAFNPYFGFTFSLKAMIAVAFGGMGSVTGALIGGILLGLLEAIGSYMVGPGWADAIAYAVFILVIIFLPGGLLGRTIKKA